MAKWLVFLYYGLYIIKNSEDSPRSAIINCNPQFSPSIITITKDQVALLLELENFTIALFSIYSSPSDDISTTISFLEHYTRVLGNKHQIISGDFNAHSVAWGYRTTDPKGRLLEDFLSSKNYVLLNATNTIPTFDRLYAVGWPDLTFISANTSHVTSNWTVRDEISLSDHKYITFEVTQHSSLPILPRYNLPGRKINQFSRKVRGTLNRLRHQINSLTISEDIERFSESLMQNLQDICHEILPKRTTKQLHTLHWWNSDLRIQQRKCRALRRRLKSERRNGITSNTLQVFQRERALYKRMILICRAK
ncbi:uncharacterized protein LOC118194874 [Stegodyphus dumicola]|uniref:uncharacterized protein LOC118194874 n=1 Tax=Stegodyphus dumicola TaxID=202533 RepID=UPI0015AA32D3|nr:uncharacterized protein LOC118194874 [Stegodyphus dumicola]